MNYLDLRILDNPEAKKLPEYPEPVNTKLCYPDLILVLVCKSGQADFSLRGKNYTLVKNGFLCIAQNTPFIFKSCSEDFEAQVIIFNESILHKVAKGLIGTYFTTVLYEHPLQTLPAHKGEMFSRIFEYLKFLIFERENFFYKEIVKNYLEILFYEGCNQMLMEKDEKGTQEIGYRDNIRGKITQDFLAQLEKNIKGNRKVEYYAMKLNMSAKYMSFVIKETTGKTPTEWINEYTLTEARVMLRDYKNTIQSISYDLGFSTPSHFGKFFKEKTGMTPKEYRRGGAKSLNGSRRSGNL